MMTEPEKGVGSLSSRRYTPKLPAQGGQFAERVGSFAVEPNEHGRSSRNRVGSLVGSFESSTKLPAHRVYKTRGGQVRAGQGGGNG